MEGCWSGRKETEAHLVAIAHLSGAQCSEVLSSFGHDVLEKLEGDAPCGASVDGDVKLHEQDYIDIYW